MFILIYLKIFRFSHKRKKERDRERERGGAVLGVDLAAVCSSTHQWTDGWKRIQSNPVIINWIRIRKARTSIDRQM